MFPISVFLAKLRREHYLRLVISAHSELSVAIHAAIYLVEPRFLQNSIMLNVAQQYSESMRPGLSLVESEYLKAVVPRFTQAKSKLDMEKWTQAVDLTAHRVGLLIANDLTLAARFIGSEPESVGGLETKDKLAELLRYAVSPQYFEVRQQLGIAL